MAAEVILIIDDNPSHLKLEKIVLGGFGYDLRVAASADEALKVLEQVKPDLILMDIQLPGISGLDLTRVIKADPNYHDITIIAITAFGMKGDREMALAAGCDGYLSKPIDIDEFPKTISELLSKKKK